MSRLKNDLVEIFIAISNQTLDAIDIQIDERAATTVMLVSGGYPETYEKGKVITGLEQVTDSIPFHAGAVIKDGKIVGMLDDVAYQSNTQEFWNSCVKICDKSDYRMFGSFFDGKGQPSQISAVSHGSSTSRFNNVNVINTGRSI